MEREDDVQLIQRVLSGDDIAFSILVERYQKSVHALVWRKIGDFHYAEEITQDTFLQVYKKLPTLKDLHQFAGWLYVIANRRCLNWLRKQKSAMQSLEDTRVDEVEKLSYTHYLSEHREAEAEERRREVVKKLLEKLPESERTVMTLFYLGEMTMKEISKFLGVSVKTISSRLSRARKRLREKEEALVQEVLGGVQISANLTQNVMQQVADLKLTPPSATKPLLPWAAFGAAAVLILFLIGLSNQHLTRFQKPYSFEAESEPTIELVDVSIVLETDAKPALRNQSGRAVVPIEDTIGNGLQVSKKVSTSIAPVSPEDTQTHWMPDPALRAVIREELGLPGTVPLTKNDIQRLERLSAEGRGIADITGLEFAENLVHLHLGDAGNYVIDLSPLTTLTTLRHLNMGANQVTDLKPLATLTNLIGLSLWNNQVTDVSSLRSLTSLTYLNLADNRVNDLSPLANLRSLEVLDLFDNRVENIVPLTGLESLRELILTDNRVGDLSPLAGLTELRIVLLKGNPIKDFTPLLELNLTKLKYDGISDPSKETKPSEAWMPDPALRAAVRGELGLLPDIPLTKEKVLKLGYLYAHDKDISDITGLEFATNLRELHLSQNPITDLGPLSNLTQLVGLHFWHVPARPTDLDLRPLANLINLEMLSLEGNWISDVRPLMGLKKLRRLHLSNNQIEDVRPLVGLTELWELFLERNPITDLAPLSGLNLTDLNISNNPIKATNISPLAALKELRTLDLLNNGISDIRPLSGLTELRTLLLKGNPVKNLAPLSGLNLTHLKYDVIGHTTGETDLAAAWMPDPALRTAVRGEIGLLPDIPLTKEKMQEVGDINVAGKGISDITGLEFATNLTELDLRNNPITDLRPIANLTTLKDLYLSDIFPNTPTLDLRPLANLINLEELTLANSKVADIRPLARFKKLRILNLSHNDISDPRPLIGLRELQELRIEGNPIKDWKPLSELNLIHPK
jgi:RNA polymerase sigma factor (sigma-70 family)